jgi:hypothetical protein
LECCHKSPFQICSRAIVGAAITTTENRFSRSKTFCRTNFWVPEFYPFRCAVSIYFAQACRFLASRHFEIKIAEVRHLKLGANALIIVATWEPHSVTCRKARTVGL